jgi:N-carbamoyl-L-amino-acid hydrolase
MQCSGFRPKRSIELLVFTSEEPTRFGIGCLGSRLLSGALSPAKASTLTDSEGRDVDEVRREAGFSGELRDVQLPSNYFHAFVELHIEQGPLLEQQGIALGIVSRIAAPACLRMLIEGSGGHAGAVLMPERRDALCAAAEMILAIENAARATGAADTVATVGVCEVFPGAVNSIPSRVAFMVDVRDTDLARRDEVMRQIDRRTQSAAKARQVSIQSELLNADAPEDCASQVIQALSDACRELNLASISMVSRAYHDSLFMSRIAPAGMLFIPCRNGYSHRPDEYASPEDIARGALVLANALARLAG